MIYEIFFISLILAVVIHFSIKSIINSMDRAEINLAIFNNRAPKIVVGLAVVQLILELVAAITGAIIIIMIA